MESSVNDNAHPVWRWEKTDPSRSGSSGDLSKLFRHEGSENPGVLAVDEPSMNASVVAREVIQNSWDSARERKKSDTEAPQFQIDFEYRSLSGEVRERFIERLDLASLARRAKAGDRDALGLRSTDALSCLESDNPLAVLVIRERGTTGMYGPFKGARSKMFLALVSLGYTIKDDDAGGSYGYGKAGLIRGSATRTVVAYSCFHEQPDDPGITRRLLGMTYWGQHSCEGTSYTGFARFSKENLHPFENERADEIAESLGLEKRDPSSADEIGTTFLLIDPTVPPEDLRDAVVRSWWPAIIDGEFVVEIRTVEGQSIYPRPRKYEHLKPFIRAYEIATAKQDNAKAEEKKVALSVIEQSGEKHESPGQIGLVADTSGWSYAEASSAGPGEALIDHRSLVALMRGTKMVVEYRDVGRSTPYVRGVFVAGRSIDSALRRTEPKGHNTWSTEADRDGVGVDVDAAEIAKIVLKRIRDNVNGFRKQLKPEPPPPDDIHLPLFDKFMRTMLSGKRKGPNPPLVEKRPVSIRLSQEPEPVGNDEVRVVGTAHISLSEHHPGDHAEVSVAVAYRFVEDERVGSHCLVDIDPPSGFAQVGDASNVFKGVINRGTDAVFEFATESYEASWTGRLYITADIMSSDQSEDLE